jgi:hypothetical protein
MDFVKQLDIQGLVTMSWRAAANTRHSLSDIIGGKEHTCTVTCAFDGSSSQVEQCIATSCATYP